MCGDSSCVAVTGSAFGSHFAEAGCTGREYYYTPYFSGTTSPNPDGVRHTWDGKGLSGTTYRSVAVRSFKDAAGNCHNDWPNGNPLNNLVRIYRTLDGCPVGYHRQAEVYYRAAGGGSDQRLASACVRPVGGMTCSGVIDSRGVALSLYIEDYDWLYANLHPPSFQPTYQQSDMCQDPANNNFIAWPVCSGATSSMIVLYGVGPDRCAFLEP